MSYNITDLFQIRVDFTDKYTYQSDQSFLGYNGCGDNRCMPNENCDFDCTYNFCKGRMISDAYLRVALLSVLLLTVLSWLL